MRSLNYEEFRQAIISKSIEIIDNEAKKINDNIQKLKLDLQVGVINREAVVNIYLSVKKIESTLEFMSYYFTNLDK